METLHSDKLKTQTAVNNQNQQPETEAVKRMLELIEKKSKNNSLHQIFPPQPPAPGPIVTYHLPPYAGGFDSPGYRMQPSGLYKNISKMHPAIGELSLSAV